ncbi:MAG: fibronectin type III domain-containing protein [candidate division WOR-3 bacterium]|nr:fibronectin type III domain-containing protein [candidate division WOR-3 bacterium]MDW7987990.1 fibronectin type III domain-containing protein [candidate division WOR-3 bacterium]
MTKIFLVLLSLIAILQAQVPKILRVYDKPNDSGKAIIIEWRDEPDSTRSIVGYEIYRRAADEDSFYNIGFALPLSTSYEDASTTDNKDYYYYVKAVYRDTSFVSDLSLPVRSYAQWFHKRRLNVLVFAIIICGLVIWYTERAKKGEKLYVRRISGLDAIDDAVGRATEMGRPILFSFGLGVITDVVTIAALSILRKIARKSAEYQTKLIVPNYDPIVMAAAQETVKQAYLEAGRPDLYNENNLPFLTSDQFGYAAGVDGIMLRERPGAVFWQGYFFAESLILAETGHSIGAIQIAGTTAITQLPFFIAACDYTLIGEEMYAASCYLNPEPQMLGSLKGEDTAKMIITILFIVLVLFATLTKLIPSLNNLYLKIFDWFTAQ